MTDLDLMQITLLVGACSLILGAVIGYLVFRVGGAARLVPGSRKLSPREAELVDEAERRRLREIYDLISKVTSTLKYQRVLDTALDLSASVLPTPKISSDRLVSAVMLFSQADTGKPNLTVGSARRFTPADMRIILLGNSGLIGSVLESGEGMLSTDVASDPELSRFVAVRACGSAYCTPLRAGLDTYGVMLYAHPDRDYFTPASREILDILAHQAVIAIQNARLYNDLEQEKERMLEIQEEARKKLARDLHDGPTQSVAAIAMRVNFVRRLAERDPVKAADELRKVEDLARRTTKEIRHMLFTLRPLVLESQGLVAALEAMAEKAYDTYGQNVVVEAESRVIPKLEQGKQTIIFYIADEAVSNARKHAQAAHVWIRLREVDYDIALLEIQDDGVGFNIGAVDASYDQRGSLGLVNMRERAELVGGVLNIDSAEGKGTTIQVLIPVSEDGADRLRKGL